MVSGNHCAETTALFDGVVECIRSSEVTPETRISDTTRLRLYGLYKRVTEGKLLNPENGEARPAQPSKWNPVAYYKYESWAQCDDLTETEAIMEYVRVAASQPNYVGEKCKQLLETYQHNYNSQKEANNNDSQNPPSAPTPNEESCQNGHGSNPLPTPKDDGIVVEEQSVVRPLLRQTDVSIWEQYFGMKPILPRGQLDITYNHLLQTLLRCFCPSSRMPTMASVQTSVTEAWGIDPLNESVVCGLSVRTLWDLLWSAMSVPPGSEIIMVPPINIHGMVQILQHHDIHIVPVDIPQSDDDDGEPLIQVDLDAVMAAITKNTVAIMVIHPFGLVSTSEDDMKSLNQLCSKNGLLLIEDCAECYTGNHDDESSKSSYCGSEFSDVRLFSFGTIKTSTSLGGGLMFLRHTLELKHKKVELEGIAKKMMHIQKYLYGQQTNREFGLKIIKCLFIQFVCTHPTLFGFLIQILQWLRLDYQHVFTNAIRGFQNTSHNNNNKSLSTYETKSPDKAKTMALIKQIRQRPSPTLLYLLQRRLLYSQETKKTLKKRLERCQKMTQILTKYAPKVRIPSGGPSSHHYYWLFPIRVDDPDYVCRHAIQHGFDIPRGTSQLDCISNFLSNQTTDSNACDNTQAMMKQLLYLPIPMRIMSEKDMIRLAQVLNASTQSQLVSSDKNQMRRRKSSRSLVSFNASMVLLVGVFMKKSLWMGCQNLPFLIVIPMMRLFLFTCIMVGLFIYLLRIACGPFYMRASNTFARYCSLLRNKKKNNDSNVTDGYHLDLDKICHFKPLNVHKTRICDTTENKNMALVTGVTGFIGSLLLRDLLRYRQTLNIPGGVVVICRSRRNHTSQQRIDKLLSDPMFSFLTDEEKRTLVTVVEGDVTLENVGLSKKDLDSICHSHTITHVYHVAASVSFTQTLEEAAVSNITSALQMQELTSRLKCTHAKFIFISTAFVHGDKKGSPQKPLLEELFRLDPFDPEEIYRSMLTTQTYASNAMRTFHFPNTYTFSKCVSENLLMRCARNNNTIIIRPSIVGPAIQEPYEGWAGTKPSTLVAAVCLYLKFQFNIWSFQQERVPVIPVDVVCKFILAKTLSQNNHESQKNAEEKKVDEHDPKEDYLVDDNHPKDSCQKIIYNAAWSASSPAKSQFLWYNYALTAVHYGAVKGYISTLMAYIGVFVTIKFFPAINISYSTFTFLHKYIVQTPLQLFAQISKKLGMNQDTLRMMDQLRNVIDLPVLFFPFTVASFNFDSEMQAPSTMDGERYLFSCVLAAGKFIERFEERGKKKRNRIKQDESPSTSTNAITDEQSKWGSSVIVVGGKSHKNVTVDSLWAMAQPRGNCVIRLIGWFLRKIFRRIANELTVDIDSFASVSSELANLNARNTESGRPCVVLVPTHRSFLDFLILSYIIFALPELQLEMPKIAAADDFSRLPFLGWLAYFSGAFFIKRGNRRKDPDLENNILKLKRNGNRETSPCIEVFIEGQRSRDRRFLKPKTGFLRCLKSVGGDYIFFPISISYEQIPEQSILSQEANGKMRGPMLLSSLALWLKNAFLGKINIGRIHVSATNPLSMHSSSPANVSELANSIQQLQQKQIFISEYHVAAGAKALGVEKELFRKVMLLLGCNFWPSFKTPCDISSFSEGSNEVWTIFLQIGHIFAPFFRETRPQWASWLNPTLDISSKIPGITKNPDVFLVISTLGQFFDNADKIAKESISLLNSKGFYHPTVAHAMQYSFKHDALMPQILIRAAMCIHLAVDEGGENNPQTPIKPIFRNRNTPTNHVGNKNDKNDTSQNIMTKESFGSWGYQDSGFIAHLLSNGTRCVTMKGSRYGISGRIMPKLVDFLENESNVRIQMDKATFPLPLNDPFLEKSGLTEVDLSKLLSVVAGDKSRLSTCQRDRARHGTGQSQEDMYLIRSEMLHNVRMPDAVIWPKEEKEVEALMALASKEKWCIMPFGGGTNVTHALRCPSVNEEPRPIISVDMRLMKQILWINEEDNVAHVQAGITGAELADAMMYRGYTIGHEPDSIEFSTLGGWIATKASGMKQNKYGNIENIVKEVFVVSPAGILYQQSRAFKSTHSRVSTGTDLCSLMIGSEGNFGIITSAVIRIFPLPEVVDYESVVFPCFGDGFGFVRDIAKLGSLKPASVRLLDNDQFRLGQALKGQENLVEKMKSVIIKTLASTVGNFEHNSIVCTTLIFEGSYSEVSLQKKTIKALANKHNGILAGSKVGKSGYELTFAIAYLRDFALSHYFLAESFETFVPWSLAMDMIEFTKRRIFREHKKRSLPGMPLVSCRITQLYDEGVCVYFYLCMNIDQVHNPHELFAEIECAAREEILDRGGSLSHHHGVGKLRAKYISSIHSSHFIDVTKKIKRSFDPENVLASNNGSIGL